MNEIINHKIKIRFNQGSHNNSYIKSISDVSKISKSIKKKAKTDSLSNFSRSNTIKIKMNNNNLFKDISEIKPKENFYCNQDIKNSIFNEKGILIEKDQSIFNISKLNLDSTEKIMCEELSDYYFKVSICL